MTNRLPLALGLCAGYLLGRTRKAKLALTLAGMAAGKKLPLSPQAVGSLLTEQLNKNPQLKEVRDQLRQDLGGVGKAATGALVERQVGGLADRLESRTRGLQDRLTGGRDERDGEDEPYEDSAADEEHDDRERADDDERVDEAGEEPRERPARAKKSAAKKTAAKKPAAGKKAAPAGKTAKKTASGAKRSASSAKKTASAGKSAGGRGGGRRG